MTKIPMQRLSKRILAYFGGAIAVIVSSISLYLCSDTQRNTTQEETNLGSVITSPEIKQDTQSGIIGENNSHQTLVHSNQKQGRVLDKEIRLKLRELGESLDPKSAESRKARYLIDIASLNFTVLADGLKEIQDARTKKTIVSSVIGIWSSKDPNMLGELGRQQSDAWLKNEALKGAIKAFSNSGNFSSAEHFLDYIPESADRNQCLAMIGVGLLRRGQTYDAALQWANALPNENDRSSAEISIAAALSDRIRDPDALVVAANSMKSETAQRLLVTAASKQLALGSAEELIKWVGQLPESLSSSAQAVVCCTLARRDIDRATDYLIRIGDQRSRLRSFDAIQDQVFGDDFLQTSQWLEKVPSDLQQRGTGTLAYKWGRRDAISARKWAETIKDSALRASTLAKINSW